MSYCRVSQSGRHFVLQVPTLKLLLSYVSTVLLLIATATRFTHFLFASDSEFAGGWLRPSRQTVIAESLKPPGRFTGNYDSVGSVAGLARNWSCGSKALHVAASLQRGRAPLSRATVTQLSCVTETKISRSTVTKLSRVTDKVLSRDVHDSDDDDDLTDPPASARQLNAFTARAAATPCAGRQREVRHVGCESVTHSQSMEIESACEAARWISLSFSIRHTYRWQVYAARVFVVSELLM